MRWNLADQAGWLDGNSVRLLMEITNLSTVPANAAPALYVMVPGTSSPASMFRRFRVIANGSAVLEDIDNYGRTFQIMSDLLPSNRKMVNIGKAWGGDASAAELGNPETQDNIAAGTSRTVCVQLLSSFLSQGKMIPLSMLPITIELELDDMGACFTQPTGPVSWEITRPRLVASVCDLDQTLNNSYAKHLLDGKRLPLYMHGMYSVVSSIPSTAQFTFPIARGFTRLSGLYMSFYDQGSWTTRFYSPNNTGANTQALDTMQWNITIGSERWPSFDGDSHQESFYRLRQATQAHLGNDVYGFPPYKYLHDKFIVGQTLEKAPGQSSHTGVNTRSGSQLTLNFKNLGNATMIHVILHYEQIVNLSAAGVEVLD